MVKGNFVDQEFEKEFSLDDDQVIREEDHGKLLQSIEMMDSQLRIKPPTRTEPSFNVSEFDLAPIKGGGVHLKELAHALEVKGKAFDSEVATKIRTLTKTSATLQKPLEKNQQKKIKRVVAYNNLTQQVSRWDAAVQTNRAARTIAFPMNIEPVTVKNASEVAELWQSQSQNDFEAGLNALHGMSKVYQEDTKVEQKFRMTLAELRLKRREIAKLRAQQSFEAAKARRQNKIKSKSYHRMLRREKMQKQLKEFEALQKTDPEAALKRLEELERVRAEERMTLRHKNTGHWARSRLIRAKYDPQTRQQLAEQLAVSRDLTKKLKVGDSSEDEETTKEPMKAIPGDEDNPWITVKSSSEIDDFLSGYRKYWDERNKNAETKENAVDEESDKYKRVKKKEEDAIDHSNENERMDQLSKAQVGDDVDECEETICHESLQAEEESEIESNDEGHSINNTLTVSKHENEFRSSEKIDTTDKEYENGKYKDNKEVSSTDTDDNVYTSTVQIKNGSVVKTKLDRKSKRKKIPKYEVKATCQSWIITPISNSEKCVSTEKQGAEILEAETSKIRTSDERVKAFLASVLPETLENEEKKKKKRKSTLDKMFDEVENNISTNFEDRFKKLKSHFGSEVKIDQRMRMMGSGGREEEENDLGASLAVKSMKEARPQEDVELLEGAVETSGATTDIEKLKKTASGINSATFSGISNGGSGGSKGSGRVSGNSNAPAGANSKSAEKNINPEKFIAAKPKVLLTAAPELTNAGEEALDDEMEEDQQKIITEAFADDNVVDDFEKEKEADIKKSQPGEIDLSLPGWGEWGGAGIVAKKKKSRFVIKPPPAPPRKDADKLNVIINEEKAEGIREHQIWEIPAPFRSVKDFEASIRAPVGRTWVPETAHKRLIAPTVVTKSGVIIKPMSEEFLVNKKALLDFTE
ncbi:hypothetical protein R5R35_008171 [Gryllus longicercus]|uniref:U3 small nucleolar RNA-associated protein 14 homolog A n=1 Tax=Gryllus longicercus TaxID=2509291 RepID=A0AAN9VSJ9_9ORTH